MILLIFIKYISNDTHRQALWLCKCDCGNEKIILAASIKSGKTKSCGCHRKTETSKRMSGKNSPSWNPDLTKEDRKESENTRKTRTSKYNKLRKKVYKRDNYACQCCGDNNGGNLEGHHLCSWYSNKKFRYVTSNGVTLCKECHKKFHKEFGRKNNTRKQFTKFLQNYNSKSIIVNKVIEI